MADSLLSPTVGGVMWAATGATLAVAAKRMRGATDDRKVPLMGVLGAFVFATQMVNFTIPGTGSSGHLGGGLILAALLGPHAAFLTMASILTVQALFFADGGLLALGCNIFNLGAFPAYLAYPFVFRPLLGGTPRAGRLTAASLLAGIVALQTGAFAVVVETVASGVSALPFSGFALAMQPIHLAIGIVEGLVTAAVISFVWKARPEIVEATADGRAVGRVPLAALLAAIAVVTVVTGGLLSRFASRSPDGLEWSLARIGGGEERETSGRIQGSLEGAQKKSAFFPDYRFRKPAGEAGSAPSGSRAETSVAGVVGAGITLLAAAGVGLALRRGRRRAEGRRE